MPASLVICNDVFAYIWGITFGRTPLIKLSPKKTVEGFVGAFWSTMIFGVIWGTFFMQFDYMICPVHDLGVSAWSSSKCTPNPVFVWRDWQIWSPLALCLSNLVRCFVLEIWLTDQSCVIARTLDNHHPLRSLPIPPSLHVWIRVASGAVWRFLCVGIQACLQY